jgi:hypothetical protein
MLGGGVYSDSIGTQSYHHQGSIYRKISPPPPLGGGEITADVIWEKKYEKGKRKRRKM